MIKIYAPAATAVNMAYWTTKGLNVHYWISTTIPGVLAGYAIEMNEPDEDWATIKPIIAGFADLLATNKVRVSFDDFDPGCLAGRLSARTFWVHSDGTQTET